MPTLPRKDDTRRVLSFTEHLEELRVRIIICIAVFGVLFFVGFFFAHHMIGWLILPLSEVGDAPHPDTLTFRLQPDGSLRLTGPTPLAESASSATLSAVSHLARDRMIIEVSSGTQQVILGPRSRSSLFFLSPLEPFFLLVKGALLISALCSLPVIIYQIWLFVAPGLTRRERRAVKPILLSSLLLFPLGALFAYFIAHVALKVLIGFSDQIPGLQPNIVASEYLQFLLKLMLVFGIVFEFPLILLLLSRIGIIDSAFLVAKRRHAILIIAVLSAIFTPPDPFSMVATIVPLVFLFELSIWMIRAVEKSDRSGQTEIIEPPHQQ